MRLALLAFAFATRALTAMPNANADQTDLTLYRSDDSGLYSGDGGGNAGFALIHERRAVKLASGRQTLWFDGLPTKLDSEALDVRFGDAAARVLSRRLLLPDASGVLATHLGDKVTVYGDSGNVIASGTLHGTRDGLLLETANGPLLVRDYASVLLPDAGELRGGARLAVAVDAKRAGNSEARLDYATSGLGWRAAYSAVLGAGDRCELRFESRASIANFSGRDWHANHLTLVAGEPDFAKSSGPRPVMMSMRAAAMPTGGAPRQSALGDYRRYVLAGAVDLPAASVTQVPLYTEQSLACKRRWIYETGSAWSPPRPMLERGFNRGGRRISSRLEFTAFDSLPAGYLRVSGVFDGNHELLGEARIGDTPKGHAVKVELGTPFDLSGERERTAFHVDKAGRTLDEAFRISLDNAGDSDRVVTVREHPNRWREWTLVSSSIAPSRKTGDTLEFEVKVPAHGKASLEYAVNYHWSAADDQ